MGLRVVRSLWPALLAAVAWAEPPVVRFEFAPDGAGPATPPPQVSLAVPACATDPVIDARDDDAAWTSAAELSFPAGEKVPNGVRVRLCRGESALFLLAECAFAPERRPTAPSRPRDDRCWADDCLELWLDPAGDGDGAVHFIVSAGGSIYDESTAAGASYNPAWRQAAAVLADRWVVEVALPPAALGLKRWLPALSFNVGRNGPGLRPTAWAGNYGAAEAAVLLLAGVTAPPETGPGQPVSDRLRLTAERTTARPGERWLPVKVALPDGLDPAASELRATVTAKGAAPITATARPTTRHGTVSVDVRRLGQAAARLRVELLSGGRTQGAEEVALAAESAPRAWSAGDRIEVQLDAPDEAPAAGLWPVTFGVPFRAGELWSDEQVKVVDEQGRELPSQVAVTGTWAPDGAVRWLRIDALVNPAGRAFVTHGRRAAPAGFRAVTLTERGGELVLETGAAVYRLGPGSSPVQSIAVGGRVAATAAGARGLYLIDQRGRLAAAAAEGETVKVESAGPVAACVRFEGEYRTADGEALARHITRVEAFAGQPFARVTHTLVLTRDTFEVWFKEVGWELAVAPGAGPAALFATARDEGAVHREPLTAAAPAAYLLQDRHYLFAHGDNHCVLARESADGRSTVLAEGQECGDWAAVTGSSGGLLVACREAARQHPKEFAARADRLTLKLFSPRAGEDLDFRPATLVNKWDLAGWYTAGVPKNNQRPIDQVLKQVSDYRISAQGWSKTHELLFTPVGDAAAARLAALHSRPVYALADPAWICASGAFGEIHPKDPARFAEAEAAVDAAVRQWRARVDEWGDFGFVDYFMGPHLSYRGKYVDQKRYAQYTYTLRSDLWRVYARSGDRLTREFAQATNRAQADACMGHWDGPGKTRGLYLSPTSTDTPGGGATPGMLPFYWERYSSQHISSATNLNSLLWDYHLTGYRRAGDVVAEYVEGIKRTWSPAAAKRDQRALCLMRLLVQAYQHCWDPALREMAEATFDTVYRPDAPLRLYQRRTYYETEERNTSYKTQVDLRAVIDAWEILGGERYHDTALRLCRYWWQQFLGHWPLFYCNPQAVAGSFLHRHGGDPRYPQGLAVQVRQAASAVDPATGRVAGVEGADSTTFLFEGVPYAEALLVATGADRQPTAAWLAYEDFGYPTALLARGAAEPVALDLAPCLGLAVRRPGGQALDGLVRQETYRNQSVMLPAGADRVYELAPGPFGQHLAVAGGRAGLVLWAPHYWRPAPAQAPGVRYYFQVPADARLPRLEIEGTARLFAPDGRPWPNEEPVHGRIELPADRPGLWSFLPVDNQLVKVANLPPFFAAESAESWFQPPVEWRPEPPEEPVEWPKQTDYVPGAGGTDGDRALYIARPTLRLPLGEPHPSGDGRRLCPHRQGTLEFWLKPSWGTTDLPLEKGKTLCRLEVPSGEQGYALSYRMAPRHRDAELDFYSSHCLNGWFYSTGPHGKSSLQAWRRTVFEANRWTHLAWVWGWRNGVVPRTIGYHTRPHDDVLVMELYVDGRLGQNYNYRWLKSLPAEVPTALSIYDLAAAVDELRISDVQRYTAEFTPARRFESDPHTRVLFHFDGDVKGVGQGHDGVTAELK